MMEKKNGLWVISMSDLHRYPTQIRYRLSKGDHFLLTHFKKALAYIRPVEEEDLEVSRKMMPIEYLRNNRDEFIFEILDGNAVVISFHRRSIAIACPEIPDDIAVFVEKDFEIGKTDTKRAKGGEKDGSAANGRRSGRSLKGP
jgi:hypothetical protein